MSTDSKKRMDAEFQFEYNFYEAVAGGSFDVIHIPCPDGYVLSDSEKAYIAQGCTETRTKLVYSIQVNDYYVVFGLDNNSKVGIIPSNKNAFHC